MDRGGATLLVILSSCSAFASRPCFAVFVEWLLCFNPSSGHEIRRRESQATAMSWALYGCACNRTSFLELKTSILDSDRIYPEP